MTSPTAAIGYTNFGFARGIAADSQGNTYVSDWGGHRIMKMTSGGVVSVFAGDVNLQPGSADGQGTAARFNTPNGLAVDAADNVYVADVNNDVIRKITPSGNVTTIGGLANQPANAADGIGSAARFYRPVAVAVDTAGKIYVADDGNQRISVGILAQAAFPAITIQPTSQAAGVGSSLTLQVSASGAQPLSYQPKSRS